MRKIIIIVCMMCLVVTGCTYGGGSNEQNDATITLEQIKNVFKKHGIPLTEKTDINPDAVFSRAYNDIKPEQFSYNTSQNISIYMYSSSKEAKKGLEDFAGSWAAADLEPYRSHHVANVLFFYGTETTLGEDKVTMAVEVLKSLTKE
ncbi:hypothetical protein [Bacillus sp. FJAT-28004]|uniref:hypothetical protein n=1 Tax=Bacillus sp. FJAT-28004 TaxID=1679165 RepID=UPI0006B69E65|nr:hypothetical protein [Bacillus sp. FJAT-28004]